jgi:erythromycin esterase
MKNTLFIYILFSSYLFGQVPSDCYSNQIIKIDDFNPDNTDYNDFQFLKNEFKNKRIIILGESGHGDGSTFEAKTKLIKFLIEEMNYSTLAFEGGGFLEMAYASSQINKGENVLTEISKSWFQLWSKSKQTQNLIQYIDEKKDVKLLGIENQLTNEYSFRIGNIIDSLVGKDAFKSVNFESFQANFKNYYISTFSADTAYSNNVNIEQLKKDLNLIKNNVKTMESGNSKIVYQGIKNIEGYMIQLELNSGSYDDQNQSISMRDSLMADNIIWYLNENPNEKIIIWTANFHATRTTDKAIYKENDDFYQVFNSLASRLIKKYKKDVYTIAFTSIRGEQANIYQPEPEVINIDVDSWDSQMASSISYPYAFINFKQIRSNPKCGKLIFNSTLLGYQNHIGDWFNIFDGVFLIKTMQRSKLVK